MGHSPSGTDWSSLDGSHGPQVLPENLLPCRILSMGHSFLQGTSTCSSTMFSMGCSVDICSSVVISMGCRDELLHRSPLHRLQGNVFFSAWSTSAPCFFTDFSWVPAGLFLSHFFLTCLSHSCCVLFFTLSLIHFIEIPITWLMGSAVSCDGNTEASWNRLESAVFGTGQPRPLLTEGSPAPTPSSAFTPFHLNPTHPYFTFFSYSGIP